MATQNQGYNNAPGTAGSLNTSSEGLNRRSAEVNFSLPFVSRMLIEEYLSAFHGEETSGVCVGVMYGHALRSNERVSRIIADGLLSIDRTDMGWSLNFDRFDKIVDDTQELLPRFTEFMESFNQLARVAVEVCASIGVSYRRPEIMRIVARSTLELFTSFRFSLITMPGLPGSESKFFKVSGLEFWNELLPLALQYSGERVVLDLDSCRAFFSEVYSADNTGSILSALISGEVDSIRYLAEEAVGVSAPSVKALQSLSNLICLLETKSVLLSKPKASTSSAPGLKEAETSVVRSMLP